MRNFGIPEPHKPRVDPSEFEDPFFGGEKKQRKPTVYMELGEEREKQQEVDEVPQIFSRVSERLKIDPNTKLTQQEASLIYQVDQDIPDVPDNLAYTDAWRFMAKGIQAARGLDGVKGMSDEEIHKFQDFEHVKSLIIERLRSEKNVIETSTALLQVAEGLGLDLVEYNPNLYMQTLKEKIKDWEERGVFDYLTLELIKNNNRHNIVVVPNDPEIGEDEIVALAKKFGERQPESTFIDDGYEGSMYGQHHFSSEPSALTGYSKQAKLIRLSLMPTKFSAELGQKPAAEHQTILSELQAQQPNLYLHVPSLLDAVTHWYVLRAQGDKLQDNTNYDKTYIRNFDVEQFEFKHPMVPCSDVDVGGRPNLYDSFAVDGDHARVSVG